MFKTDTDRLNYGEILKPPYGFTLNKAIGTTYSLDLEALTAIAISTGLAEDTDSKLTQNPIAMLNALQKVSERIIIFSEAGQIKLPNTKSPLCLLLEKMVVPVALPKAKGMSHYPAFHPKTWLMDYVNEDGEHSYRFVVMSRNLTFDRSWDISIVLNSSKKVRQVRKTKPIIDFIEYLKGHVKNTTQLAGKKRSMINSFMEELKKVSFSLESREFEENFQILPMGIGEKSYKMWEDELLCDTKWSASSTFHDLVIMSPFLSDGMIESWNMDERGLTNCKRTLITRKSELSKLKAHQVSNFDIYTLKDNIVDGEDSFSDETIIRQKQDIHAKVYLRRKDANTDLYLGSMNASHAAVYRNVEMMIWLGTKNRFLNGDSFLRDIFGGDADAKTNPFELSDILEPVEDKQKDETDQMEQRIKAICRCHKKAKVIENQGRYDVEISFEGLTVDENTYITPLCRNMDTKLLDKICFHNLDLIQLSEFYVIKIVGEHSTMERVIMIPTEGLPEERESAVVNQIVNDKKSFVEYLAFVLGEDYLLSMLEGKQMGESGFYKQSVNVFPALYEKMLRTALEDPKRLNEISYLLKTITDKDIIPDEFRDMYETFRKTCKLK